MQTLSLIPGWPFFYDIEAVQISITPHVMMLTGYDLKDKFISVEFNPLQALKLTSIDWYSFPENFEMSLNQIFLVQNSVWLSELRTALSISDFNSTDLENSQHFIIMGHDMVFEIIAREWEVLNS